MRAAYDAVLVQRVLRRLLVLPYHGQVRLHSRPILLRLFRAYDNKNDHTYQKDDADRRDTPKQTRTHILSSLRKILCLQASSQAAYIIANATDRTCQSHKKFLYFFYIFFDLPPSYFIGMFLYHYADKSSAVLHTSAQPQNLSAQDASSSGVSSMALLLLPQAGNTVLKRLSEPSSQEIGRASCRERV